MKEHPILFAPDMAAAVRDGRKTQTRRVIVPQPKYATMVAIEQRGGKDVAIPYHRGAHQIWTAEPQIKLPYGTGDRLRMLTTWAVHHQYDKLKPTQLPEDMDFVWTAFNLGGKPDLFGKLRPGRFCTLPLRRRWMPLADVLDVRVERVQDISEADARAEGMDYDPDEVPAGPVCSGYTRRIMFQDLWDSINAKRGYAWAMNPRVFVVSFKRVEP